MTRFPHYSVSHRNKIFAVLATGVFLFSTIVFIDSSDAENATLNDETEAFVVTSYTSSSETLNSFLTFRVRLNVSTNTPTEQLEIRVEVKQLSNRDYTYGNEFFIGSKNIGDRGNYYGISRSYDTAHGYQTEWTWNWGPTDVGDDFKGVEIRVSHGNDFSTFYVYIDTIQAYKNVTVLKYDVNGGYGGPENYSDIRLTETTLSGTVDTNISPNMPTRDGMMFKGWAESPSSDPIYQPSERISLNIGKEKTLYAVWGLQQFVVSFDTNGGNEIPSLAIDPGSFVLAPENPTLYGYTFRGWFTDNGIFLNEFDFTTPITSDITLYAKWEGVLEYTTDPVSDGIVTALEGHPGTVSFSATDSLYYSSVLWDFGDGITSTDLYATHYYSDPGTYTATLTVYNNHGSDVTTYTIEVPLAEPEDGIQWTLVAAVGIVALLAGALIARRLL